MQYNVNLTFTVHNSIINQLRQLKNAFSGIVLKNHVQLPNSTLQRNKME
jgi:hypothetical protein